MTTIIKLYLIAVCLAVIGCGEQPKASLAIGTREGQPLEVKIVNPNPGLEAKVKDHEARLKGIEAYLERQGRRYK